MELDDVLYIVFWVMAKRTRSNSRLFVMEKVEGDV